MCVKDAETIYETKVIDIGKEAQQFKSINMLIFFGDEAPEALRSSCFIIDVKPLKKKLEVGQTLKIDDTTYKITGVGDEASRNFNNLGHMSVKFNGSSTVDMPGSINVEDKPFPKIKIGTKVSIY